MPRSSAGTSPRPPTRVRLPARALTSKAENLATGMVARTGQTSPVSTECVPQDLARPWRVLRGEAASVPSGHSAARQSSTSMNERLLAGGPWHFVGSLSCSLVTLIHTPLDAGSNRNASGTPGCSCGMGTGTPSTAAPCEGLWCREAEGNGVPRAPMTCPVPAC